MLEISRMWTKDNTFINVKYPLNIATEIHAFKILINNNFKKEIEHILELGYKYGYHYEYINDVRVEYISIDKGINRYNMVYLKCNLKKFSKLLQLFADEEFKLKIQKEIFKEI